MGRLIFHVDVNSAFLSWEAARRVREGGEDLRLIPSCISGDPQKRTSIILAKSIPAKQYGIKTGEPVGMALQKCRNLVIAPPDFKLYEQCSRAFTEICRSFAPKVEKFSIDECFLDMSNTEQLYPDPIQTAHQLKDTIRDTLGFTVNVGIGSNKLLAKMASDFEKPDKVHTLFTDELEEKFFPLAVSDLISVGRGSIEKLERCCIRTIGDLARYDVQDLQKLMGRKFGQQLHDYANGHDPSPVEDQGRDAKGYSISTTLENDLVSSKAAQALLLNLTDHVALRMRADAARAGCVSVTIRTNDFKDRSHQKHLQEPCDITEELYQTVKQLFEELWDQQTPLRLLGVSLTQIIHDGAEQMSLFPDPQKEKERKIDKTMDALRSRYGMHAIARGSVGAPSERIGRKQRAQFEQKQKEENK